MDRNYSYRAQKSGDAFQLDRKLERKYDVEEALGTPQRQMAWINAILEDDAQYTKISGNDWKEILDHLKTGIVLCKLINKLLEAIGMPPVGFRSKAKMSFVMMANVEGFNKAAMAYGVPEGAIFQTVDLVDGRKANLVNVINCINQLGVIANSRGFVPQYEVPEPPKNEW
jgi:hypothetical protein